MWQVQGVHKLEDTQRSPPRKPTNKKEQIKHRTRQRVQNTLPPSMGSPPLK